MLPFMVLVFCASLACCLGKPAGDMPVDRCYPPDQLEGRMVHIAANTDVSIMKFYADHIQKAMRFTGKGWDVFLLWNQGVQYTIAGGKCYRIKLDPNSYHPLGVSDAFNLITEGQLGGEMMVQAYGVAYNGSGAMYVVSKKTCAPAYVIGKQNNETTITNFLDVRTCVSADAFTVPAVCRMSPSASHKRDVPDVVPFKRGLQWHYGRK